MVKRHLKSVKNEIYNNVYNNILINNLEMNVTMRNISVPIIVEIRRKIKNG